MKQFITGLLFIGLVSEVHAQGVSIGAPTAHSSAILDISSGNKGLLIPRLAYTGISQIASPAEGLMVYDTDNKTTRQYDGSKWQQMNLFKLKSVGNNDLLIAEASKTNSFLLGLTGFPAEDESFYDGGIFFINKENHSIRLGVFNNGTTALSPSKLGSLSVGLGTNNVASGYQSFAAGNSNQARGSNSVTLGNNLVTRNIQEVAVGCYNDTTASNQVFSIGNGGISGRSNALTVLSNGRAGFFTSNPAAAVHISTPSAIGAPQLMLEEKNDPSDGARLSFRNDARTDKYWDLFGLTASNTADARFNFFYNGYGDIMSINGNGRVGIGTPVAAGTLHVLSASNASVPQQWLQVNSNSYVRMRMNNTVNPAPYWDMASITHASTASSAAMNFFYSQTGSGGLDILSLKGNGNAVFYGTVTANGVTLTSDQRLKKDITHLEGALGLLEQLHGYQYHWKDERRGTSLQTGLLAQEVEKLMPELVISDEQGTKSVNYSGLIPYLLEGLKSMNGENQQLKERLDRLEKLLTEK